MGSFFSKKADTVENRLLQLEQLDRNHDNVVSKEEFQQWITEFTERFTNHQTAASIRVHELERENEALRQINRTLTEQLADRSQPTETTQPNYQNHISSANIESLVNSILENPQYNVAYLPDIVEKQMYHNVFKMFFGLLDNVIAETAIKLPGHQIRLYIRAVEKSDPGKASTI